MNYKRLICQKPPVRDWWNVAYRKCAQWFLSMLRIFRYYKVKAGKAYLQSKTGWKILTFLFLFLGIFIGIVFANLHPNFQSFEQRRAGIIHDMNDVIEQQVKEGNYGCCIEPACTMCFMGEWLWDDGICRCDKLIRRGESDKICPQCKKGLEEGQCKSSEQDYCEIET